MNAALTQPLRALRFYRYKDDIVQTVLRISNIANDPAHLAEIESLAVGLLKRLGVDAV